MTFEEKIAAISGQLDVVVTDQKAITRATGATAMSRYRFRQLLTDDEADAWLAIVEAARNAIAAKSATNAQKTQFRAWRDFNLAAGVDLDADETKAAIYALHLWGVLTKERADRVASGKPPE